MLIVAAYDVDLTTKEGISRLRRVARVCEKWGVRVQNSVFELMVDQAQFIALRTSLERVIDPKKDSVRFYRLGNHYERKITVLGRPPLIRQDQELIL